MSINWELHRQTISKFFDENAIHVKNAPGQIGLLAFIANNCACDAKAEMRPIQNALYLRAFSGHGKACG